MVRFCGFIFVALIGLSSVVGCGGGSGSSLEGAVTYNGEPVQSGSISFMPVGGVGTPFGAKIVDGRYETEKVFAGKFKATITGNRSSAMPKTREEAEAMAKANQGQPVSVSYIAEDAPGNAQEIEVTGADQTLDFTINGPPRS